MERPVEWLNKFAAALSAVVQVLTALAAALAAVKQKRSRSSSKGLAAPDANGQ